MHLSFSVNYFQTPPSVRYFHHALQHYDALLFLESVDQITVVVRLHNLSVYCDSDILSWLKRKNVASVSQLLLLFVLHILSKKRRSSVNSVVLPQISTVCNQNVMQFGHISFSRQMIMSYVTWKI